MRATKTFRILLPFAVLICGALSRRAVSAEPEANSAYVWNLPKGFPKPYVPADNLMTAAKVELGRYLFYDTRLSVNGKSSCGTCHQQDLAFTDGKPVGVGATGEMHSRNAMSLVNIAYAAALTWSNPKMTRLEEQALTPMFSDHPIELGLNKDGSFLTHLRDDKTYQTRFEKAFPGETDRFTITNVTRALASFERSIISARSPYDRYHYDRDDGAISESAKRGEILFFNQHLGCFRCHGGAAFTDSTMSERNPDRPVEFHNTGLYNLPGATSYPAPNLGIYEYTKKSADIGKFKVPTLRNIAVTAPYMHDGSIPTLDGVLDHYSAGGRAISSGPNKGNGHDNPNKDPIIGGFTLSQEDRQNLIEFLKSLTDETLLHDPQFANPWPEKH